MKYAINTSQRFLLLLQRGWNQVRPFDNQSEVFDAVITDPPYLNCPDLYTEEKEDLSNMTQEEWEEKMGQHFLTMHD